jgi:hypothetical protein
MACMVDDIVSALREDQVFGSVAEGDLSVPSKLLCPSSEEPLQIRETRNP